VQRGTTGQKSYWSASVCPFAIRYTILYGCVTCLSLQEENIDWQRVITGWRAYLELQRAEVTGGRRKLHSGGHSWYRNDALVMTHVQLGLPAFQTHVNTSIFIVGDASSRSALDMLIVTRLVKKYSSHMKRKVNLVQEPRTKPVESRPRLFLYDPCQCYPSAQHIKDGCERSTSGGTDFWSHRTTYIVQSKEVEIVIREWVQMRALFTLRRNFYTRGKFAQCAWQLCWINDTSME
jgi:hypothetical protein